MTATPSTPPLPAARARKSLGQHFLVNDRVLDRIVAAAQLAVGDLVVEIGPGRGALTRRLLSQGARVVAIEMDEALAEALPARLSYPDNLVTMSADARTVDINSFVGANESYKVVANLPYYAANPIVRRFLEGEHRPSRMVVMVQREVAESMTASPGRMSLLSVATQFYAGARMVCSVPPSAFRPAPKVTSAVVCLDILPQPALEESQAPAFFDLVRAGFSAPRKQLHNSLGHGLGQPATVVNGFLAEAGVDGARRAGTLSLDEWLAIYSAWTSRNAS